MRTHWTTVFVKNEVAPYFDCFGVEYISKEVKKFIANKISEQIFTEFKYMIQ